MRKSCIAAALAAAASLATLAQANDSTATLGTGGLVLTQSVDIRMASEDLWVSRELIRVRYRFINESGAAITTRVAFPLPEANMEQLTDSDAAWPMQSGDNVVGFRVIVDGRRVKPALERRAYLQGNEVTDVLARLGVPIDVRAHDVAAAVNRLAAPAKQELASRKLINLSADWAQPLWTVKNTYHWQQKFRPGRPVKVEHTYKPVVGASFLPAFAYFENPEGFRDSWLKRHCVDDATRAAVEGRLRAQQRAKGQGAMLMQWSIAYVLSTGKNWKGPIERFRLTLDKGRAGNIISLCMDGVRKTGPTRFTVERSDFEPDQDLSVLILETPTP